MELLLAQLVSCAALAGERRFFQAHGGGMQTGSNAGMGAKTGAGQVGSVIQRGQAWQRATNQKG